MPVKPEPTHNRDYQEQPGINVGMMEKDSTQFPANNSLEFMALGDRSGPFVGDPYSGESGLGTVRGMITYTKGGKGKHIRTKAS